jgi:hypothetical protein
MNILSSTRKKRRSGRNSRKRQRGGETIEFALLAALVFLLLFGIIEFAIAMYNEGVIVHSSRVGAREASLFWVDINQLSMTNPETNQRIKTSEVESAASDFADRFLVSFSGAATKIRFQDQPISDVADTLIVGPGDEVSVRVSLDYRAPVSGAIAHLANMNLAGQSVMRVE